MFLFFLISTAWIWVPALVIYLFSRSNKPSSNDIARLNSERDQLWHDYLLSFQPVVKTEKEKRLLGTLLEGKTVDDLVASSGKKPPIKQAVTAQKPITQVYASQELSSMYELEPQPQLQSEPRAQFIGATPSEKLKQSFDNTLLLLYFGAFLLVASVGLFVAISGLSGVARTAIVGLTAAVLYGGGLWLYETNKKLAQAGISFVGTGMVIAPLTGVAWYNLVANQSDAGLVWLLTSIVCVGLYLHAFTRIKEHFIAYLLIGSFVSSIESAVLAISLPSYAYAWGLAAAGLLLVITSRVSGRSLTFNKAGDASAQLLAPLSVLGSIVLLPQFGSLQLAVTLVLAGSYYSLLAYWQPADREQLAIAAQTSYIGAISTTVHAAEHSLTAVGISLIIITVLYGAVIAYVNQKLIKDYSLIAIAGVTSIVSVLLCIEDAWSVVAALSVGGLLAVVVWQKLQSDEALQVGGLVVLGLPFVIGLAALKVDLDSSTQLALSVVSAVLLYGLAIAASRHQAFKQYYNTAAVLYVVATILVLVPASLLGFTEVSVATAVIALSFVTLRVLSSDATWLLGSGIVTFVPLAMVALDQGIDTPQFSGAVAAALVWNIGVSLATRQALARALVVAAILIAPFAIGGGGIGIEWSYAGYAGGYVAAMASCLAARAIARGKLLLSFNVPIASYYTEASQAYIVGYVLAGTIALGASLYDVQSQMVTTLVLGAIAVVIVVASKIEQETELLSLLPLVAQAMLFSGLRPDVEDAQALGVAAALSSLLAVAAYGTTYLLTQSNKQAARSPNMVSVVTAYIGPALVLLNAEQVSWLLPVSLLIAGILTYDFNRSAVQEYKELSLGVCIVSIHWFLYVLGYTNIQVHTHLLAVFLAGFAWWRSYLHDKETSDIYVEAAFLVVTVPLALQSLSGESGSLYGLLLIAEQVAFILIGTLLNLRVLLQLGLWTGLAAILFQLRGLGWAFLSVLAVIIIGIAVYRLQKHPPDDSNGGTT